MSAHKTPKNETDTVHTDTFEPTVEKDEVGELNEIPNEEPQIEVNELEADKEISEESSIEGNEVVEKLQAENALLKDQLLRKVADFENQKRRIERERVQLFTSARVDAIRKFLDINDDLVRTLDPSNIKDVPESFLKGVVLIAEKYKNILDGYNVAPINEINVPFDVDRHDALLRQQAPDESIPTNTVIQILEPGYMMGEFVIRHAKVIVSQ